MASKFKRRISVKKLHVHFLRAELWLCILLILCTIGLQLWNLVSPPEVTTSMPAILGDSKLSFRLTTENIFPFMMLPMLFLVIAALYLQKFFSQNSFGIGDHIPFFKKHPRTRFGKKVCMGCAVAVSIISFILCVAASALYGLNGLWFGWFVVVCTSYLHCFCAKQLRHRRRQYYLNRNKAKQNPSVNGGEAK